MKRIFTHAFAAGALLTAAAGLTAAELEPGFTSLCDGKTFDGWKIADESTNTWTIQDGAFVAHGSRCHLYYVGDSKPFKNFDLKVDVMTDPNSNGGIYFHTKYQAVSWPKAGFECQVNKRLDQDRQPLRAGQHCPIAGGGWQVVDPRNPRARQQYHGAGGRQEGAAVQRAAGHPARQGLRAQT